MCHSCHVGSSKATPRRFPTPRRIGRYDYRAQIIALGPEYNKHKCSRWCFRFYRDWRIKCLLNHPFAPFLIPNGMLPHVNVKRSSRLGAAFRKTPESLLNPVSNADSDEDEESGYASSESGESPSDSNDFASESEDSSSKPEDYASECEDSSSDSGSIRSTSTGSTLPFRQPPPPPSPSPELAPQQVPNSWCGGIDCPFPYCMFDS